MVNKTLSYLIKAMSFTGGWQLHSFEASQTDHGLKPRAGGQASKKQSMNMSEMRIATTWGIVKNGLPVKSQLTALKWSLIKQQLKGTFPQNWVVEQRSRFDTNSLTSEKWQKDTAQRISEVYCNYNCLTS